MTILCTSSSVSTITFISPASPRPKHGGRFHKKPVLIGRGGAETFILARSNDRRAKELAMHEKFIARLETGLKKMQAAAKAGRLKDESAAGERLGRLKQQNWRASHLLQLVDVRCNGWDRIRPHVWQGQRSLRSSAS